MIVEKAIEYFAKQRLRGQHAIWCVNGVVQSLSSSVSQEESLIDQVDEEEIGVMESPLGILIRESDVSFEGSLKKYYLDYAQNVLRNDWVRILDFRWAQAGREKPRPIQIAARQHHL